MNQTCSGIILTASKADLTICEVFGNLSTGLIPVNGKPIIFFILQQMLNNGIYDLYIGIGYEKENLQNIVNLYFSNKLNITYIITDQDKGPGNSLLSILKKVKSNRVIINLGDTYIKNFTYDGFEDSFVVSKDFLSEEKWATIESKNNTLIKFRNKEKVNNDNTYAICGLYSLNDIKIFDNFLANGLIEINDLLEFYNNYKPLKIHKTLEWLDFGHIDKYYISKKRLIQSRNFNTLEYDNLLGTITKRSKNKNKFRAEIQWQLNIPKSLKVLSPRILDYSISENPFVTMEFYSYPTLAEIWLFSELNEKIYISIITKLFKILQLFKKNKKLVKKSDYINIYINKTLDRVNHIKNKDILDLFQFNAIIINTKEFQNWDILKEKVFEIVKQFYDKNDNCLIHGDFCLSNILYDLRSGIVRLIDPRGIWGSNANGDIKYDIAKLRHSICGDYDYIVNDLFNIEISKNNIEYTIFNSDKSLIKEYFDKTLSSDYNIKHIKIIEGLLFLSMIALHNDNTKRQIIMYCKAIELLNEASETST